MPRAAGGRKSCSSSALPTGKCGCRLASSDEAPAEGVKVGGVRCASRISDACRVCSMRANHARCTPGAGGASGRAGVLISRAGTAAAKLPAARPAACAALIRYQRHSFYMRAALRVCAPLFALRAAPLEARRAWHMRAAPAVNTHVPITLILSPACASFAKLEVEIKWFFEA